MEDHVRTFLQSHGGHAQRALYFSEPPVEVGSPGSELANSLLRMVGWGLLSCVAAQHLAKCAINDGADREDLHALASIGSEGGAPGNCRRDLLKKFAPRYELPKPIVVSCNTFDRAKSIEQTPQAVLSLPELLESVWVHSKQV